MVSDVELNTLKNNRAIVEIMRDYSESRDAEVMNEMQQTSWV